MKIWAANDIRIFVRMMTQRNVELQLQALDVIERRHFNSTASSSLDDPEVDTLVLDSVQKQRSEEDTELDAVFQEEMKYTYNYIWSIFKNLFAKYKKKEFLSFV